MELYVLAEANDIAALFPAVRPCDGVFSAYADHAAAELERHGARVPPEVVEGGLALLDTSERRRIVDSWRNPYRDRWAAMVADGGDEPLLERAAVAGAVCVAILERVLPPRAAFIGFEGGVFTDLPANALALLVPPPSIWSIDEAVIAGSICPGGPVFEPARFEALEQYAGGCVTDAHLSRLRDAATRIERQLPVDGLPTASATLAEGCAVIAADDGWCAAIAARQLALYVCNLPADQGAGATGAGGQPAPPRSLR